MLVYSKINKFCDNRLGTAIVSIKTMGHVASKCLQIACLLVLGLVSAVSCQWRIFAEKTFLNIIGVRPERPDENMANRI